MAIPWLERSAVSFLLAACSAAAVGAAGCKTTIVDSPGGNGGTTSTGGAVTGGNHTGGNTGGAGGGTCPISEPSFDGSDPCDAAGLSCEYGQECCQGSCFPSYVCDCSGGTWSCYYTDACFGPPGCDPGLGNVDDDGDGYTEEQGDCNDCDPGVNPGAAEVIGPPDPNDPSGGIKDDDCDGLLDDLDPDLQPCDGGLALDSSDPMAAVRAIGICDVDSNGDPKFLTKAAWVLADGSEPGPGLDMAKYHLGHGIVDHFGQNDVPREGKRMLALSTGTARNKGEPGFVSRNFDKGYSSPPPATFNGESAVCPGAPVSKLSVQDAAGLELTFQTPSNALSVELSFNFRTYDFPEYACSIYNDSFWVNFVQAGADKNIAFDAAGEAVSGHSPFLTQCECPPGGPGMCSAGAGQPSFDCQGHELLDGTDFDGNTNPMPTYQGWTNAGTRWLRTTAPVVPSQTMKIRFVVFDGGVTAQGVTDHNLDSMALVDRFKWSPLPAQNETSPE